MVQQEWMNMLAKLVPCDLKRNIDTLEPHIKILYTSERDRNTNHQVTYKETMPYRLNSFSYCQGCTGILHNKLCSRTNLRAYNPYHML
jgi:hypothetical protein